MKKLFAPLITFILALTGAARPGSGEHLCAPERPDGQEPTAHGAKRHDGNAIIQYNHWSWKCMTWQFVPVGENTYQLRNLYTFKTLQPSSAPAPLVPLSQQPVTDDKAQHLEFVADRDDTYLVKLKGTNLYITALSRETNSQIVLHTRQNSSAQQWRLIKQDPWF